MYSSKLQKFELQVSAESTGYLNVSQFNAKKLTLCILYASFRSRIASVAQGFFA